MFCINGKVIFIFDGALWLIEEGGVSFWSFWAVNYLAAEAVTPFGTFASGLLFLSRIVIRCYWGAEKELPLLELETTDCYVYSATTELRLIVI